MNQASDKKKIIVLGSGPTRIGQGMNLIIVACTGLLAYKESGYEAHHGELQSRDCIYGF